MSGQQTQVLFPITYGQPMPAGQNPLAIQFIVVWNAANVKANHSIDINLLQAYQTNKFTTCQTVYIDNSTNPNPITLTCDQTQETIFCPGFSQGYFPLLCSFQPSFLAQNFPVYDPGSNTTEQDFTTTFYFINVPMPSSLHTLANQVSVVDSFTAFITPANAGNVYPITPQNGTIGLKTLIYSVDLSIAFNGTLSEPNLIDFYICEVGSSAGGPPAANSDLRYIGQFYVSELSDVFYFSRSFNPPAITRNNNNTGFNNLGIYFSSLLTGLDLLVTGNVSYGLIQTG